MMTYTLWLEIHQRVVYFRRDKIEHIAFSLNFAFPVCASPLEIMDTTLREGQQTSLLHDYFKYFFTSQDSRNFYER